MKRCRVLVVEDYDDVRCLIENTLVHQGLRVESVIDARKARRLLERHGYHLAVVDVTLPGGEDGLSLARYLRPLVAAVIMTTGNHSNLERIRESGLPCLLKPFRLRDLSALVDSTLHQTNAPC